MKLKLIEVSYDNGSGWKTAKTAKLCKLLKRIFGKNAGIVQSKSDCYLRHVSGQSDYYTVVKGTKNSRGGWIVGTIFIGGYDGETFPEDFFEEDEEN